MLIDGAMSRRRDVGRLLMPLMMLLTAGAVEGSWSLMMNESETRRILGVGDALYYVRDGTVNDYALTFNVLLRADVTDIYFSWNASADQSPMQYRLSAVSSNTNAIPEPLFSVAKTGLIPTRLIGFSVGLPCSGLVSAEVDVRIVFNVTSSTGNTTVVEIRRRKACFVGSRQISRTEAAAAADEEDKDRMSIAMNVNVKRTRSRGMPDGVVLYACIGSACLASILVGALVVACRRRTMQSRRAAAAAGHRLQPPLQTTCNKHRLSAFDAQQKRQECIVGSEKLSYRNSASDCNRTAGNMSLPAWSHEPSSLVNEMTSSSTSSASRCDVRITRQHVSLRKLLMEGTHGLLYYAVFADDAANDAGQAGMLVKTVTDKASRDDVEQMLRDACLLRGVHHNNVKSVAAVCVEPGLPPLLVYRFDNDCNLKIYLQLCRTAQLLTGQQLVFLAVQITYALQFLHQQSIYHKDVAARNCTVDDSLTLRLGDSALASTLFPLDYHSFQCGDARLPVKWMSAEALEDGIYNAQSDVWSLGVTLWEMTTYGSSPYADVDVCSYLAYIRSGYRLPQLTSIQNELYGLMKSCWHQQSEMRPNCTKLLLRLNQLYSSVCRPSSNA